MIFIGIDPGTKVLGFSALKKNGEEIKLISSGTMSFEKKNIEIILAEQYDFLFDYVKKYLNVYGVVTLCVENQFVKNNPRSAFLITYSKSMVILIAGKLNLKLYEIEPCKIKKAITGSGAASKEEIVKTISFYFKISESLSFDEADAIACSLSVALAA